MLCFERVSLAVLHDGSIRSRTCVRVLHEAVTLLCLILDSTLGLALGLTLDSTLDLTLGSTLNSILDTGMRLKALCKLSLFTSWSGASLRPRLDADNDD
jgi:hypothetical protein